MRPKIFSNNQYEEHRGPEKYLRRYVRDQIIGRDAKDLDILVDYPTVISMCLKIRAE